jgi:hypothetical protein
MPFSSLFINKWNANGANYRTMHNIFAAREYANYQNQAAQKGSPIKRHRVKRQ